MREMAMLHQDKRYTMARKIAVIGGGVIGTSVAWHLACREVGDIVLIERDRLGSGTTWHSAGNVTWIPGNDSILTLYDTMEQVAREADQDIGWLWTGRLFLARTDATLESFRAMASAADARRIDNTMLEPADAVAHHPLLDPSGLAGAWLNSKSGRVNPADLTSTYARAARRRGVTLHEGCNVTGLEVRGSKITRLVTTDGPLDVDAVVVCCGLWSRRLLSGLGLLLPQWGCEHFYMIARPEQRLERTTPSFVSPDDLIYGREEVGDMLLGSFDEGALPLQGAHGAPPDDFSFSLLNENWDKFGPYAQRGFNLFPALEQAPVRRFVNGPETFTSDGEPLLGAYGSIDGLFIASGMNSAGVTFSALAGHVLADAVTETPSPRFDPAPYRPDRFADRACNEEWIRESVSQVVSGHYKERFEA